MHAQRVLISDTSLQGGPCPPEGKSVSRLVASAHIQSLTTIRMTKKDMGITDGSVKTVNGSTLCHHRVLP